LTSLGISTVISFGASFYCKLIQKNNLVTNGYVFRSLRNSIIFFYAAGLIFAPEIYNPLFK
jgi:hypothetical protein